MKCLWLAYRSWTELRLVFTKAVFYEMVAEVYALLFYQLLPLGGLPRGGTGYCSWYWGVIVLLYFWSLLGGHRLPLGCLWFYLAFLEITVVWGKDTHLAFLGVSGGLSLGFGADLRILLIEDGEILFVNFGFYVRFPISDGLGEGAGRMMVSEWGGGQ